VRVVRIAQALFERFAGSTELRFPHGFLFRERAGDMTFRERLSNGPNGGVVPRD
jgi:hypothetical protein